MFGNMKIYATISADIVESTSLSKVGLQELTKKLSVFLTQIKKQKLILWGRLVKGDLVECLLSNPSYAFRVSLMLKSFVKSFCPSDKVLGKKFKRFGVRLAIGIGGMRIIDPSLGIMDGEAIYLSGRALSKMSDHDLGMIQIISKKNKDTSSEQVIFSFLNHLINQGTNRQCEILYYRLQSKNEKETAKKIGISRPGVNQGLRALGWNVINQALQYFEKRNWE